VALLQAITFDDYDVAMHALQAAFSPYAFLYFLLVIVLCGFFVINLFLAVMFDEFMSAKADDAAIESAIASAATLASPRAGAAGLAPVPAAEVAGDLVAAYPLLRPPAARSDDGQARGEGVQGATAHDATAEAQQQQVAAQETWLGQLVAADWFSRASLLLVLLNMGLMCTPYQGMPDSDAARLEAGFTAISLAFMVEMAIKLCALGCEGYWADGWNALDGTIVLMSSLEMLLQLLASGMGIKLSFLRMLRLLRVIRVLRLMRSWQGLYRIVSSFIKALPQLFNMFVLMFLTMLIFSLMGMQLFGGKYDEAVGYSREPCVVGASAPPRCPDPSLAPLPRFHFDYFQPAMTTVFVLLTGKWSEAMEPATRTSGPIATFFFAFAVLIGIYLIMNLFVAILLNTFAEDFAESTAEARQRAKAKRGKSSKGGKGGKEGGGGKGGGGDERSDDDDGGGGDGDGDGDGDIEDEEGPPDPEVLLAQRSLVPEAAAVAIRPSGAVEGSVAYKAEMKVQKARARARARVEQYQDQAEWRDTFACVPQQSRLRAACVAMLTSPYFDPFIILAILASSFALAVDSPRIDPASELARTLHTCDYIFLLIFTLEMLAKVIALGVFVGPSAYCHSGWNVLDFFIVLVSYLSLLAELVPALAPLRSLRILRVLRPMRARAPPLAAVRPPPPRRHRCRRRHPPPPQQQQPPHWRRQPAVVASQWVLAACR
jgi:hypothetical protein